LLAVEIAIEIKQHAAAANAAKSGSGNDFTPYIGAVMFLVALVFVWRSFYSMRIPEKR
jgi:K(+)-stimulated pyrophosphate-energized sodium pump